MNIINYRVFNQNTNREVIISIINQHDITSSPLNKQFTKLYICPAFSNFFHTSIDLYCCFVQMNLLLIIFDMQDDFVIVVFS